MCFVVGNSAFGEKHKQTTGGSNWAVSPTKICFWGYGLCCSCFKLKSIFYGTKTIRVIIFFEILSENLFSSKIEKKLRKKVQTQMWMQKLATILKYFLSNL